MEILLNIIAFTFSRFFLSYISELVLENKAQVSCTPPVSEKNARICEKGYVEITRGSW